MNYKLATLALVSAVLAACSSDPVEEEEDRSPLPLISIENEVELDVDWARQVGNGLTKDFLKIRPVVQDGVVYAADSHGLVEAIELETGGLLWTRNIYREVTGGLTLAQDKLWLGTDQGEVYGLDVKNGDKKFVGKVSSEILSRPQAWGNRIVVQSIDGKIYGLNSTDGSKVWDYDSTLPILSLRGTSTPLVEDGRVFAGFASGKLVAIDVNSGNVFWETRPAIPEGRSELERLVDIDGELIFENGLLFVTSYQGNFLAIDSRNGRIVWKTPLSSYHGPTIDTGNAYVINEDDELIAYDLQNGSELWTQKDLGYRKLTRPVAVSNYLAVADFDGYIHLLKQRDGEVVGRSAIRSAPSFLARPGSYHFRQPARAMIKDEGIRTELVPVKNSIIAINNAGYLVKFDLEG